MNRNMRLIKFIFVALSIINPALAEPTFVTRGSDVVSIRNLLQYVPDCQNTVRHISGVVVKREFASDALTINGFVIEMPDGARLFINIYIESMSRVTASYVMPGLQKLVRNGRHVNAEIDNCSGGSGVFWFAKSIW